MLKHKWTFDSSTQQLTIIELFKHKEEEIILSREESVFLYELLENLDLTPQEKEELILQYLQLYY